MATPLIGPFSAVSLKELEEFSLAPSTEKANAENPTPSLSPEEQLAIKYHSTRAVPPINLAAAAAVQTPKQPQFTFRASPVAEGPDRFSLAPSAPTNVATEPSFRRLSDALDRPSFGSPLSPTLMALLREWPFDGSDANS